MKRCIWILLLAAAVIGGAVLGAAASGSAEAQRTTSPSGEAQPSPREGGRYFVALRVEPDANPGALLLCGADGTPLSEPAPDEDGDAALGPLRPGSYRLCDGQTELGSFLLADNAAILRADGRLWTDGELLHLAARQPAALTVRCELARPGYYSFTLTAADGAARNAILSIPEGTAQDACGCYLRHLLFEGLPPGRWQLTEGGAPCASGTLAAGETAQVELKIP